MTPVRATVPKVGRKAVTPHLAAGYVMDPAVSEPIANGTIPIVGKNLVNVYLIIHTSDMESF